MVDGLATNQSLTCLDLSSNHLSHHGVTLLASALLNNSSLTQLGELTSSSGYIQRQNKNLGLGAMFVQVLL